MYVNLFCIMRASTSQTVGLRSRLLVHGQSCFDSEWPGGLEFADHGMPEGFRNDIDIFDRCRTETVEVQVS
jgi:hypothetical protein